MPCLAYYTFVVAPLASNWSCAALRQALHALAADTIKKYTPSPPPHIVGVELEVYNDSMALPETSIFWDDKIQYATPDTSSPHDETHSRKLGAVNQAFAQLSALEATHTKQFKTLLNALTASFAQLDDDHQGTAEFSKGAALSLKSMNTVLREDRTSLRGALLEAQQDLNPTITSDMLPGLTNIDFVWPPLPVSKSKRAAKSRSTKASVPASGFMVPDSTPIFNDSNASSVPMEDAPLALSPPHEEEEEEEEEERTLETHQKEDERLQQFEADHAVEAYHAALKGAEANRGLTDEQVHRKKGEKWADREARQAELDREEALGDCLESVCA